MSIGTQDEYAGIEFDGLLSVTEAGSYTSLRTYGSQLFIAEPPPRIELLELEPPPPPLPVAIGQIMSPGTGPTWSTLTGTVTFVGQQSDGKWELEMSAGTDHLRALVVDVGHLQLPLLLGSKVEMKGVCEPAGTSQIIPGLFWVLQTSDLKVLEVAGELWSTHPATSISNILRSDFRDPVNFVHVRGRVYWDKSGTSAWMEDETGELSLAGASSLAKTPDGLMDVIGTRVQLGTNIVLQPAGWKDVAAATIIDGTLPVLTTAMEIRQLKREEAERHYPVKIRGVITSILPQYQSVIVQDDTRGICVTNLTPELCDQPQIGDYWEVEGVTSASTFAPKVAASRVTRLAGAQPLPTPAIPTWDQLMNGSLDAQYTEIRGAVTAVNDEALTLLTPNGRIEVFLTGKSQNELLPFENTLVRIRGALFAEWDGQTHQVQRAKIRFFTVSLNVDQAAPADPFDAPKKRAAEIRLFDASASAMQRIQLFGQIICARRNELFLLDGNSGLRFAVNAPVGLAPGDLVKVSGFPDVTGPFPMLRDAVARKTGNRPLPAPNRLENNAVAESGHDATWVQIEATLLALRRDGRDQILEMQSGIRTFIARLATRQISVSRLPPGSRLRLTGVYADQGRVQLAAESVESFELLLNSPADIEVLARPPWWNFERLMAMIGFLLIGLAGVLIWITQLRRQVEKRSIQLQHEIRERHRVEQQRALAEERSRIARDLHDDLGTSLTEINLLAEAAFGVPATLEKGRDRFRKIGDKTRSVVEALDVMVWLVNPRSDALPFIAGYLGSYAEECLGAAAITCRLKLPVNLPNVLLTSEIRHNLFLAFKEALHNVVRHARASEVVVELSVLDGELKLAVKDNGCGFDPATVKTGNGLANLSDRLAVIGGRSGIASRPGEGAIITFTLPLPAPIDAGPAIP